MYYRLFQYSLCRVVLMVEGITQSPLEINLLSVLALSSRFDGLGRYSTSLSE